MVYVADIHTSGPDLALHHVRTAQPDVTVRFEYQLGSTANSPAFITVDGISATFEDHLAEDPDISEFTRISGDRERRLYCIWLAEDATTVTPLLSRLEIHVLHLIGRADGWYGTVQTAAMDALQSFRDLCREHDIEFSIERLHETDGYVGGVRLPQALGTDLTDAQHAALFTAYDLGYFDTPRKATLQDIADELGISSSAVGRRLSRGIYALVTEVRHQTVGDGSAAQR